MFCPGNDFPFTQCSDFFGRFDAVRLSSRSVFCVKHIYLEISMFLVDAIGNIVHISRQSFSESHSRPPRRIASALDKKHAASDISFLVPGGKSREFPTRYSPAFGSNRAMASPTTCLPLNTPSCGATLPVVVFHYYSFAPPIIYLHLRASLAAAACTPTASALLCSYRCPRSSRR